MNDKEKADLAFLSMEPPKNYETWKNIGISYEAAGGDQIGRASCRERVSSPV